MSPKIRRSRDPLVRVKAHNALLNLFTDYLPLSLHVVDRGDKGLWYALSQPPDGLHPVQFEVYFKALESRYAFHRGMTARAVKSGRPVLAEHRGIWDCAVASGKDCVVAGSFVRELPLAADLRERLRILAGKAGVSGDLSLAYARSVLEAPLLNPASVEALKSACEFTATWFLGGQAGDADSLEDLKPILARECSWRMERFVSARRERLRWWAAQAQGLAAWDRRDFGLKQMPGAALGISIAGMAGDAVEDLVRMARLRHETFRLAVERGWISGRGAGEGACLLLPLHEKRQLRAAQLESQAEEVRRILARRVGADLVLGLSRPLGGERLPEAFREAEWALLMAAQRGQSRVAYVEVESGEGASVAAFDASRVLIQAVLSGSGEDLNAATDAALGSLVRLFPGRADLMRAPLSSLALELFEAARARDLLEPAAWEAARRAAVRALEGAASARELAAAFNDVCARLGALARSPRTGAARLRLASTARSLRESETPPSLKDASGRAHVSASRFSRLFKQEQGEAFGAWRRSKRLERAAELLKNDSLPVWRVAQECGYRSPSHFSRLFSERFGASPTEFRARSNSK